MWVGQEEREVKGKGENRDAAGVEVGAAHPDLLEFAASSLGS